MSSQEPLHIDRTAPPSFRESFRFPIFTPAARRDLLIGGTTLIIPPLGWILNMGHRLDVVYRIYHGQPPYYRGFRPYGKTWIRGLKAAAAILTYLGPSLACGGAAYLYDLKSLWYVSAPLFMIAIYILPGGMTYNAAFHDISYLYRPDRALARAWEGGRNYVWAWLIALSAISLSFLGLLALGIGFLYTSVWAWMVVGYAFSRALSLRV